MKVEGKAESLMDDENKEEKISMWQQNTEDLYFSCSSPKKIELMGEMDLVSFWSRKDPKKNARHERTKRKGR